MKKAAIMGMSYMQAGDIINSTDNGTVSLCPESESAACILAINPSTIRLFLYMFAASSVSLLTISGNLLVITSIIYFKQLHTPTNYLILSLAVADLLVGAFVLLFNMALTVKSCIYFGDFVCKIRRCFDIALMTTSILNLCCISIDRYFAVCQPLLYRSKMNVCVVAIMILLSWALSAFSGFRTMGAEFRDIACNERCSIFHVPNSNALGSLISFYLPVIIMLSFYLRIFFVAQQQAQRILDMRRQTTQSGDHVNKMEKKATKTLAIVMGVFLFCWTPFFLCATFNPLTKYDLPLYVTETLVWLGWSNSMLNPLVYGFFYSWFRNAFKLIITGKIFSGNFTNTKLL